MSSYDITTTKCPVCGKMTLRIGDYGVRDVREEFRVICDSCDFCSETQSSDYGEVFWDFMRNEYNRFLIKNHSPNTKPRIIAWAKQKDEKVKITFSDGDVVFINEAIFIKHYYELMDCSKEEMRRKFSNVKVYNKLVRDKIPEIIESKGECCTTKILNDEEYFKALEEKLDEEVAEYHKDQTGEELADIIEVVYALGAANGMSVKDIENIRACKVKAKGGFGRRIFLKETYSANCKD